MNNMICALFGLFVAASVEASHSESLHTFSVADSSQSFCSDRREIADIQSDIEKRIADSKTIVSHQEKHTIFSLPSVINCRTDNYSFLGKDFIRIKLLSGSEILFPTDGCQMDSDVTVELSGANLEDGLITKFYMAAFGLIKWESEYLEMGFDEENQACRIFDLLSLDPKTRRAFTTNFRKIAPNSVGRTLLYRLLFEIRRTDIEGNGCIDTALNKSIKKSDIRKRNHCRNITIIKSDDGNAFSEKYHDIEFQPSNGTIETNVLQIGLNSTNIITQSRTDDVGLFHEMLHWFHTLRDPGRKHEEISVHTHKFDIDEDTFFSISSMESEEIRLWFDQNNHDEFIIKIEEMRTIVGYSVEVVLDGIKIYTPQNSIKGDDLCENLYRWCIGEEFRYGHVDISDFDYEIKLSQKVIERVKISCENAAKNGGYRRKILK